MTTRAHQFRHAPCAVQPMRSMIAAGANSTTWLFPKQADPHTHPKILYPYYGDPQNGTSNSGKPSHLPKRINSKRPASQTLHLPVPRPRCRREAPDCHAYAPSFPANLTRRMAKLAATFGFSVLVSGSCVSPGQQCRRLLETQKDIE